MARPKKQTVEYFPHFVNSGKTMFILESNFGNDGYAFWFKVLELLGSTDGHVYNCRNTSDWEFLLAKTHVSEVIACSILQKLADLDAIDPELWKSKLIWSDNFVKNLKPLYDNRKSKLPEKPVIDRRNTSEQEFLSVKPEQSGITTTENPQSKVKESKVKESKVNNNSIENDLETVINHYCSKANIISLNFKPTDLQTVEELLKTIPADIIIKGIDLAFENYKPSYAGAKINSFGYCKPIILKLWKDINSKEALQSGGTEQNKSPTGDKDRDGIGITI